MGADTFENASLPEPGNGSGGQPSASSSGEGAHAGYLAFAAHEIRNPLSTALWSSELLARMSAADRGGARGEKLSRMCLRALARLRVLVEDHFLIERLDTGGLPLRIEPLDVREVLTALVERRPPGSGPCDFEALPSCTVSADRHLLERLLDALLGIAGEDGTSIQVSGSPVDGRLSLAIQGAPPALSGLEDPDRSSSSGGKAHCLSLPMARRAARAIGGELRIEGTRYLLSLPLHQPSSG
jgi:signal transduction histidine kinase